MYFQKKKIIKLLMGVALVGLTLAVLCSNVFADSYTVPDTATPITLNPNSRWYSQNKSGPFYTADTVTVTPNHHAYLTETLFQNNFNTFNQGYTYYISLTLWEGNYYGILEDPNMYLYTEARAQEHFSDWVDVRTFTNYTFFVTYGHPTTMDVIFTIDKPVTDLKYLIAQMGLYNDTNNDITYQFRMYRGECYYDIDGQIYEGLVMSHLNDVSNKLDITNSELSDVNDNLVIIDSSIDDMNSALGNKLTQVQNKIDAAADQAHQDAQDQVDAIEDLPQQQYDYEHQQDQNAADEYIEEFSGGGGTWDQEIDSYIDIEGLQESIGNLYGAFINNQKSYTIIFPGSGNVPILNKTLWAQQSIDLQPFATSTPGRIMIIACNGVFSLVGIIGLVVFIRRVLQDILHH